MMETAKSLFSLTVALLAATSSTTAQNDSPPSNSTFCTNQTEALVSVLCYNEVLSDLYLLRLPNSGDDRYITFEPHPPSVDPTVAERVELFDEELCVAHRSLFLAIALNCGGLGQRE